jgi:hypothetical protein
MSNFLTSVLNHVVHLSLPIIWYLLSTTGLQDPAALAAAGMATILVAIREVATGAPHRLRDVQKGAILLR